MEDFSAENHKIKTFSVACFFIRLSRERACYSGGPFKWTPSGRENVPRHVRVKWLLTGAYPATYTWKCK